MTNTHQQLFGVFWQLSWEGCQCCGYNRSLLILLMMPCQCQWRVKMMTRKVLLISSLQSRPSSSQWRSDNAHSPTSSWLLNITRICHFLQVWMNGTHNFNEQTLSTHLMQRPHTLNPYSLAVSSVNPTKMSPCWPSLANTLAKAIFKYLLCYSGCLF